MEFKLASVHIITHSFHLSMEGEDLLNDKKIRRLTLKVVLLGNSGVGKTLLVQTFGADCAFAVDKKEPTLGVDFIVKTRSVVVNNIHYEVKYQIWDTAGQERFRSLSSSYIRGASIILFVFEAPEQEYEQHYISLRAIDDWYSFALKYLGVDDDAEEIIKEIRRKITCALCMTKSDRLTNRPDIKKHVGEQCKDLMKRICSNDGDIKRVFTTTRDDPQTIKELFDTLLKEAVMHKIRSMSADEMEALLHPPSLPKQKSQQKLAVISVSGGEDDDEQTHDIDNQQCCSLL
jgi:GTPase SAR1 family protein